MNQFVSRQHSKHRHVSKNTITLCMVHFKDKKEKEVSPLIQGGIRPNTIPYISPTRQKKKYKMAKLGFSSGKSFRRALKERGVK